MSALMLVAEVITMSYERAHEGGVSRKDTGAMVALHGPASRLLFDQFSRVSVKATKERRSMLLESVVWPSPDVKRRFANLPMTGGDLFGGQYDSNRATEAQRRETIQKADFRLPKAVQPRGGTTPGRP